MAVLGLRFCARAFSSCGKRGPLLIAVRGPLTIAASLVGEHRLQTRKLSNCGSRAQPLRSMWDPPRPGLEPTSPALAGRLSTTAPPAKPQSSEFYVLFSLAVYIFILCLIFMSSYIFRVECQFARLEDWRRGKVRVFPLRFLWVFFFFLASLAIVLFSLQLQYPFTPRLRILDQD